MNEESSRHSGGSVFRRDGIRNQGQQNAAFAAPPRVHLQSELPEPLQPMLICFALSPDFWLWSASLGKPTVGLLHRHWEGEGSLLYGLMRLASIEHAADWARYCAITSLISQRGS